MDEIHFDENKVSFKKAYLKSNPFPTTALPEENPRITADRKDAVDKFVKLVNNLRNNAESSVAVFVGDWGSGKSHLLRVFNTAIQEKLFTSNGGVFPILVRSPGRSMLDFLKEIFSGINRTRMIALSNLIIENYIEKNKTKVESLVLRDFKPKFNEGKYKLEDLLEEIQIIDFFKMIRKDSTFMIHEDDLFYAILFLSQVSSRITAWSWIMGSHLSMDDKKRLNVVGSNDDNRKAKIMLRDLVQIILNTGFTSVVIFVDEFENIATIPSNQRKIFQDDIRDIIDEFNKNVALMVAMTPTIWQQFEEQTTALTRRLRSNLLQLKKFGDEDIKELIKEYLKKERTTEDDSLLKSKFPNCDPSLAPFTEESIDTILEDSDGIVSDILEYCKKTLDSFVNSDEKEITKKLIEDTLKH